MEKILILFRGLPGSGKSSLSSLLCEKVFSADMYFEDMDDRGNLCYNFDVTKLKDAHGWCQKHTGLAMELNQYNIIGVANTFTQEGEMESYFELAKKHDYKVFSIIVENRHGSSNIHGVPPETIESMRNRFKISL
jgi:predicted kinase